MGVVRLTGDAAFAAQEKQAVAQNDANTTAIAKSEKATTETIDKLAELFESRTAAQGEKLNDLKDTFNGALGDIRQRVQAIESGGMGRNEAANTQHQVQQIRGSQWALAAFAVIGAFGILTSIVLAVTGH